MSCDDHFGSEATKEQPGGNQPQPASWQEMLAERRHSLVMKDGLEKSSFDIDIMFDVPLE